jgi:hypothetical protein
MQIRWCAPLSPSASSPRFASISSRFPRPRRVWRRRASPSPGPLGGGSSPPSSQAATGHGCGGMQRSRHGIRHARSLTFLASSGRRLGRKPAGPSLSGVMPTRGILLEDGRRLHGSLGRRCAVRQGAAHGPRSSEEAASAHRRCGLQASSSLFMAPATSGPSSVRPYAIIPGQTLSAGAGRSIVPNQGSASKNPAATRNDAPK